MIDPPRYEYTVLFNASYNGYDSIDVRRKPDGRNEVGPAWCASFRPPKQLR